MTPPSPQVVADASRRQLAAEIDDAIVAALVAAILASFRRAPPSTVGSPSRTNRELQVAS